MKCTRNYTAVLWNGKNLIDVEAFLAAYGTVISKDRFDELTVRLSDGITITVPHMHWIAVESIESAPVQIFAIPDFNQLFCPAEDEQSVQDEFKERQKIIADNWPRGVTPPSVKFDTESREAASDLWASISPPHDTPLTTYRHLSPDTFHAWQWNGSADTLVSAPEWIKQLITDGSLVYDFIKGGLTYRGSGISFHHYIVKSDRGRICLVDPIKFTSSYIAHG